MLFLFIAFIVCVDSDCRIVSVAGDHKNGRLTTSPTSSQCCEYERQRNMVTSSTLQIELLFNAQTSEPASFTFAMNVSGTARLIQAMGHHSDNRFWMSASCERMMFCVSVLSA